MTIYTYYALDTERTELAHGTVDAPDVDAAIKKAEQALVERDIDAADIDIIESITGRG